MVYPLIISFLLMIPLCFPLFMTLQLRPQNLNVQSCKLSHNKYVIALTQITNTEVFAFIAVQVFKLLSGKVLFIRRQDNRNY